MKPENAIEVQNVRKAFKVYLDKGGTMKERILFKKRRRYENRQVLNGISFDVKKGEAVGLVGHNGCGKSTTLKLLTRIMYPDSGTIEMRGRVSSLIELGAGFHPDMSGRENIYINASIFGLTKKEIDERVEDIIRFSELEEFIENPVRTYSSGMYMRLAFAVAINVDADILLIDEILAVGDANFQSKCFNRMREIKAQGTTIVLVSHNLGQIEQLCDRSIWINDGLIAENGEPKEVDLRYLDYMNELKRKTQKRYSQENSESGRLKEPEEGSEGEKTAETKKAKDTQTTTKPATETDKAAEVQEMSEIETTVETEEVVVAEKTKKSRQRFGNRKARLEQISFEHVNGLEGDIFDTSEKCRLCVRYSVRERVDNAVFGIGFFRSDGLNCYGTNTSIDRIGNITCDKAGSFIVEFSDLNLVPGEYWIDVAIEENEGIPVDYYKQALHFEVISSIRDIGVVRLDHQWHINE